MPTSSPRTTEGDVPLRQGEWTQRAQNALKVLRRSETHLAHHLKRGWRGAGRTKVWRYGGSNPRPFTCKANALPLSYIPETWLHNGCELSVWIYCAVDGICVEHVCLIPCLATEVWQTVTTVHTAVGAVLHSLTCGLGVVTSGQGQYSTVRLAVGMKIPSPSCPPSVRN